MYRSWPFFTSTLDLAEMILAKADMRIAAMYDEVLLTAPEERQLGQQLRAKFVQTVDSVLEVCGTSSRLSRPRGWHGVLLLHLYCPCLLPRPCHSAALHAWSS